MVSWSGALFDIYFGMVRSGCGQTVLALYTSRGYWSAIKGKQKSASQLRESLLEFFALLKKISSVKKPYVMAVFPEICALLIKAGIYDAKKWTENQTEIGPSENSCTWFSEDKPHKAIFPAWKSQCFTKFFCAEPLENRRLHLKHILCSRSLEWLSIFAKGEEPSCHSSFVCSFCSILGCFLRKVPAFRNLCIVNPAWIFSTSLRQNSYKIILLSYRFSCQYVSINF